MSLSRLARAPTTAACAGVFPERLVERDELCGKLLPARQRSFESRGLAVCGSISARFHAFLRSLRKAIFFPLGVKRRTAEQGNNHLSLAQKR
jgi:hypothetical protein